MDNVVTRTTTLPCIYMLGKNCHFNCSFCIFVFIFFSSINIIIIIYKKLVVLIITCNKLTGTYAC